MKKKAMKKEDLPTAPTIEEIAEVSDTGEPQFEEMPRSHFAAQIEEVPWIVNASQDPSTGNVTIQFYDRTKITKLGVSLEDYKAFEATFSEKDWQASSLAFLDETAE